MEQKDALIFFRDLFHLAAAIAVDGGIFLGGQQPALLIFFDLPVIRIFTTDSKVGSRHFDLERDGALFREGDLGGGFQGVVQHVHEQAAQIRLRDVQIFRKAGLYMEPDLLPFRLCRCILQDGVDGPVSGKGDDGTALLLCLQFGQDRSQLFIIAPLVQTVQGGELNVER